MNTVPERAGPQVLTQEYVGTRAVSPPPGRALPRSVVLQVAGLALGIIGLAFLLIKFGLAFRSLGAWGYVGVAAVEFANCAMLIFPTPAPAYTFAMGAILNPIAVGFVGGTFATLGEMVSYYLGRKGSAILPDGPMVRRFNVWTDRWGAVALFGFAALPVPFDIAGIWAGAARYPLVRFVPIIFVGKTIKVTSIALAGYFGLEALLRMVGMAFNGL